MVPDETSDLPTTLPEASFLNPNRKVPSEARSLRGLFPVPVFAEFPSYSLSKNADGFLQNPFWLSYCNLRKLKLHRNAAGIAHEKGNVHYKGYSIKTGIQPSIVFCYQKMMSRRASVFRIQQNQNYVVKFDSAVQK